MVELADTSYKRMTNTVTGNLKTFD